MSIINNQTTGKQSSQNNAKKPLWLQSKEHIIVNTPSRRDGLSYGLELSYRQQGGLFIYDFMMCLTNRKGEPRVMGTSAILFNRFFTIHSFKGIDFRDIAASCIFLASKNENKPIRLQHVVEQLIMMKYAQKKLSDEATTDLRKMVMFLEDTILKTVSFDLNIVLPFPNVLNLMGKIDNGGNAHKEVAKMAYYLSMDVLHITDWSVRYSLDAIASACVNIAFKFHSIEVETIVPADISDKWYRAFDKILTGSQLSDMTIELLDIFIKNPKLRIGWLRNIDPKIAVTVIGSLKTLVSKPTTTVLKTTSPNIKKKSETMIVQEKYVIVPSEPKPMPDVKEQKVAEKRSIEGNKQKENEKTRQYQQKQKELAAPRALSQLPKALKNAENAKPNGNDEMALKRHIFSECDTRSKRLKLDSAGQLKKTEDPVALLSQASNGKTLELIRKLTLEHTNKLSLENRIPEFDPRIPPPWGFPVPSPIASPVRMFSSSMAAFLLPPPPPPPVLTPPPPPPTSFSGFFQVYNLGK